MFKPVAAGASFPRLEEEVLRFWKERAIYEKSLERRRGAPPFIFYEGPPTANGLPHPGHCLTRAMKDLFPRYRTMRGYYCERKAGWDTHGLPVEVEVSKELKLHAKEDIERYGVERFIHKCQESVWRYMKEWERLTERIGFWIKLDEAYVTYHQSYVESVWWSLKNLFDRGLLYQGHKIVWWWAQGGTALSSGEVGQGYREVADPSVYVKFPLIDQPGTSLLVWTTTPWTLPSNQFAAVHPELEYATVVDSETGERLIMAAALVETIAGKVKRELKVESTCQGTALIGRQYSPPFDCYRSLHRTTSKLTSGGEEAIAWRVVSADFVTIDSGSGVVHQAPAFGEVDYDILVAEQARFKEGEGPTLLNAVAPDGKFTEEGPDYCRGRWVKDCDKDIARDLKTRGLLYHQEQYLHDYPFCWRAEEDPLIQYPRRSWFIKTTAFKDEMLANNEQINWLPEHIKHGRFGNFLETNVDWALSRERYWGTPLPIWVCQQTGQMEAIANYEELLLKPGLQGTEVWAAAKQKNPQLVDDLKVHKPYIDAVSYDSPFAPGARMQRVSEVIDGWYDSGAMPFAQWGYPQHGQEEFKSHFPADFISEAIDQTRGWFYSQLAISTMLFGGRGEESGGRRQEAGGRGQQDALSRTSNQQSPYPHPFKNCIVLGLMLAEWWENKSDPKQVFLTEAEATEKIGAASVVKRVGKMSKQKRNYREPAQIFDNYGADALRWYFFANQAPWNSILYSERAIKESIPEFLLRLWNCYTFFVIYANIDGFDPTFTNAGEVSSEPGQLVSNDFARARGYRSIAQRGELDRWIISELNRTLAAVVERMDNYDNFEACKRINEFVDGLSNWYVRRSRDRFWSSEKDSPEKLDAYWTMYECLISSAKMVAPFVPFLAETLWQNLTQNVPQNAQSTFESVHLCDYPLGDAGIVDPVLCDRMRTLREIASLGRSARMDNKLKVRQPLASVHVILSETAHQAWLEEHDALLKDELNVKQIAYISDAEKYITYLVQPNFKRLGPRVGKLLPGLKAALAQANGGELLAELSSAGKVTLTVSGETIHLDGDDIQVRLQAKPGWAAAQGAGVVVVLNTELTPELLSEGYAKDLVRLIQDRRKALDLAYTDRIAIGLTTDSPDLARAIELHRDYIASETLAVSFGTSSLTGVEGQTAEIGESTAQLYVRKE